MSYRPRLHFAAVAIMALSLIGCASPVLVAVDPAHLPEVDQFNLWPGDPPGEAVFDGELPETRRRNGRNLEFVHIPTLEVFHAKGDNRTGAAVVICPGGGYRVLADGHEGTAVAKWLNANGITAIILRYRMYPYRHPVPMHDVQRAIRTVRARAQDWAIDPERIGVLGFSAGGHLASTAAVHHAQAEPDAQDPVERVSSRPDFAVLVYPVITFQPPHLHKGSRNNLLGPDPDAVLVDLLSSEKQVNEKTPPTLLVHSRDDKVVMVENSEMFLSALKKHDVPGALAVYETGGHGFGLGRGEGHETAAWPGACIKWLGEIGVIGGAGGE